MEVKYLKKDFKRLYDCITKYKCKFIMEVGAGNSTKFLAEAAIVNKARMVTIDVEERNILKIEKVKNFKGVEYYYGLSVAVEDIPKIGDSLFVEHPMWEKDEKFRSNGFIGKIVHGEEVKIEYETDLIRKILDNSKVPLDFFFCDSGEYCGIAEWNVVKDRIKIGGFFAIHDIYYPKSIKGFKVLKEIKKSEKWKIKIKSQGPCGLLIARRRE